MAHIEVQIARALLEIGAVGFSPAHPITFKSGLRSPVYVDNRQVPYWPAQWRVILEGFQQAISTRQIAFDVIAGIETGGIPHSSALGYILQKPSVFIRKQAKAHGRRNRVEGGKVNGKGVLLVEDLVTTGGSSLSGVEALQEAGATVKHCLAIISYGFTTANDAFTAAGVRLTALSSFDVILAEARRMGRIDTPTLETVTDWLRDPHGWAARHGF